MIDPQILIDLADKCKSRALTLDDVGMPDTRENAIAIECYRELYHSLIKEADKLKEALEWDKVPR